MTADRQEGLNKLTNTTHEKKSGSRASMEFKDGRFLGTAGDSSELNNNGR